MDISQEKIQELSLKWLKGEATPEEEQQLFDWYNAHQDEATVIDDPSIDKEEDIRERMLHRLAVITGAPFTKRPVRTNRTWLRIAAAILILLTVGTWVTLQQQHPGPAQKTQPLLVAKDLTPGSDKAILTLDNGNRIVLDTTVNGTIGHQSKADIVKANGQVAYIAKGTTDLLSYNTISTPRRGQFHVILSDGTAVWLDSESSIRFPAVFKGAERRVEISGQAYLEVAKDAGKPFFVDVPLNKMEISVLGTNFNISAYANEETVKTTLLDGAVRVGTSIQKTTLRPGQQTKVKQGSATIQLIDAPNLEQVMAWKNGMFNLGGTPIDEIMRQVARWYDADIAYEGDIRKLKFSGQVSRKKNVAELLQILEATGTVRFNIEGKKITVIPVN